eukprot:6205540-Pleurochrysis_carterae.AAC.3
MSCDSKALWDLARGASKQCLPYITISMRARCAHATCAARAVAREGGNGVRARCVHMTGTARAFAHAGGDVVRARCAHAIGGSPVRPMLDCQVRLICSLFLFYYGCSPRYATRPRATCAGRAIALLASVGRCLVGGTTAR